MTSRKENQADGPEVDLTSCDREPIHELGRVQSFGALLAVSSDWMVVNASSNIERFIGKTADDIVGERVDLVLSQKVLSILRRRLTQLGQPDAVERIFGLPILDDSRPFDVSLHLSGEKIVIELEESAKGDLEGLSSQIYPMTNRLAQARSVQELCAKAAQQVRTLTGFDRVMVYRFDDDDSGEVVAEQVKPGVDSFLGLRYPASDIPKQARALYKRSLLRIISDVSDAGHTIHPAADPHGQPLDLSLSTTRAVSPIHLEYLKNMGVGASMSISIMKRGRLWGLFACHHMSPKVLPYSVRTAAELFGQLFGFLLDQKEADLEREESVRAQILHDQLMAQLAEGSSISENFETILNAIQTVIPFDGAIGWIDGEFRAIGPTPTKEEFLGLVRFLNTTAASRVYHTEQISAAYPRGEDFAERAAGMLVLPVSRTPRDYIVLFRREIAKSVIWGGNPDKPVELGPNGVRLTPRKSFEAWRELVRGACTDWTDAQIRAAEALRVTLLEVLLRVSDAAMKDRVKAQERQELLIAELNHRVRNILNLIRSLVQQSRGSATSVTEFTEVVGGRIHALSRAHDQITREMWKPASLRELIATEAEAYLNEKSARVTVEGPKVLLEPKAFTTLSLVVHELLTNSMKYGALSDSSGSVDVTISIKTDGAMEMGWRERGGPAIAMPPTRRGFGTTIIERSIPYELRGEADISYETAGVRARFVIPPAFISDVQGAEEADPAAKVESKATSVSGDALVVEDNMIIALDAQHFLSELGAKDVEVCSTVADALSTLEEREFGFAILDINLGSETSEAVAHALTKMGTPFVFATGYGDGTELTKQFPDVKVVQKPYDRTSLEAALPQR